MEGRAGKNPHEDGSHAIALFRWDLVPSWARDATAGTQLKVHRLKAMDLQSFRCPLGAHDKPPSDPLQNLESRCRRGLRAFGGDGDGGAEQLRGQGRTPTGAAARPHRHACTIEAISAGNGRGPEEATI